MIYLLDTNIVCEATARAPNQRVMAWLETNTNDCCISCVTLGEIWKRIHLMPKGKRRTAIDRWASGIEKDFSRAMLSLDAEVWKLWGIFYAKHEAKGLNPGILDSLLAATALTHDLILVTRNSRDFPPEIRLLNPWEE